MRCNHRRSRVHHVHHTCRVARRVQDIRRAPCHRISPGHIGHHRVARDARRAHSVLHVRRCRSGIRVTRRSFKCQRIAPRQCHHWRVVRHRHRETPSSRVVRRVLRSDRHRRGADGEKCAAVLRVGDRRTRRHNIRRTSGRVGHRRPGSTRRRHRHITMRGHYGCNRILHRHRECPGAHIIRCISCGDRHCRRPYRKHRPAVL